MPTTTTTATATAMLPPTSKTAATPTKSLVMNKPAPTRVNDLKASGKPTPKKSPAKSLVPATHEHRGSAVKTGSANPEEATPLTPKSAKSPLPRSERPTTPKDQPRYQDMERHPKPTAPSPSPRKPGGTLGTIILDELTPQKGPAVKPTNLLVDSIKLMSTPRKQAAASPLKKGPTPRKAATPKQVTPKKMTPRRSITPKKAARIISPEKPTQDVQEEPLDDEQEGERIQLQDFLNMTGIQFMDLTTTKRRHTGFPGANMIKAMADEDIADLEETPSFESGVVAAACTVPMLSMYQHSCHELKSYIADGREDVQAIEADVYDNQPPLFKEYLSAPPAERHIMDNQFKNMKTNARLQSKASWYAWRSQLFNDLKNGLAQSNQGFAEDDAVLKQQEELVQANLPSLKARHEELQARAKQLHDRVDEMQAPDRAELDEARERLASADAEIAEKKRMIEQLQQELQDKSDSIEAVKERKLECIEEIKAAERVREECRGWSLAEVNVLKGKPCLP